MQISQTIILKQKKFLEEGDRYLHAVSMRKTAMELGLHESTVSRAIQNKYIQLPQKNIPYELFFFRQKFARKASHR